MKFLKKYKPNKNSKEILGKSGIFIVKYNFQLKYYYEGDKFIEDFYKGDVLKYSTNGEKIRIQCNGNGYTMNINDILKVNSKLDKMDTSKPYVIENEDQTNYYNINHQLHREDGPAKEDPINGCYQWWVNGKLHREDGPAVECDSYKEWYRNGKLHREDGPARESSDGNKEWFIDGRKVSEMDFKSIIKNKNGRKDDLSKDQIEDLIVDIIDDFDSHELKYDEKKFKWIISFNGTKSKNIYSHLASLFSRIEDHGMEMDSNYSNGKLTIILY